MTFLQQGHSFQPVDELVIAEWNPRIMRSKRFIDLLKSIEDDPAFLVERPPLVADGPVHKAGRVVYAGNRRVQALIHLLKLGWQPPQAWQEQGWVGRLVPVSVRDIPLRIAQKRALQDNTHEGEWQDEQLSELIYNLVEDEGVPREVLGFDDRELEMLLSTPEVDGPSQARPGRTETITCPECGHQWQAAA
jgi:ParB-like chromosome segregation protein Spo0J